MPPSLVCRSQASSWGLALLVAGVAYAHPAKAQVEHVPLTWNAPASCPPAEAVVAEIERNLADSGDPTAPYVAVVNVLSSKGAPWQATLRVEARGGYVDRRFVAESCEAIASAAALIIALSAESGAGASALSSPPAPPRTDAVERVAAPLTEPGAWRRAPLSAGFGGVVDAATMPGWPAFGLDGFFGANWRTAGWHLRLQGDLAIYPSHGVSNVDVQAVFRMGVVTARGCMSAVVLPVEIGLCAGGEVAALHSSGTGSDFGSLATSTQFWPSPVTSALASWAVNPRVAVFARGDLVVNGIRRNFHPNNSDLDLYTLPVVSARAALGIELGL